jgi:hypothetical protein
MIEWILYIAFFFFLFRLVTNIGKSFPLFELVAVLYLLQYGVTADLSYDYGERSFMAVPKTIYLPYAVIGCLAFIGGLFVFKTDFKININKIDTKLASHLGRIFLIIGIASKFAMLVLPESLRSIINFFIILKVSGVYALVFSDKKIDLILVLIVFLELSISAILNALLIEFIVFSMFLVMFLSLRYKISNKLKFSIASTGLLFLIIYQGVKADYRDYVWGNEVSFDEKVVLLTDLITINSVKDAFNTDISNNESLLQTIYRLNQGWQTSMTMNHVPSVIPFERGKTIIDDLISSLSPRLLYENKRRVNDYERFNYYTGYNLDQSTAMTIGVLGDFYINFGVGGSIFCLFFAGLFFAKISRWFYRRLILLNPLNIIWLPFLFSYLIRPGNEFYMVLNHLVKGLIIFYVVFKLIYPYLLNRINVSARVV